MLVFAACATAPSPEPNTLSPEEQAEGWILLFDGRTMEGWEDPGKKSPPGNAWGVEDGCLKTVPRARMREDLFTLASFGDFELKFEWKISPGGNTGVKYRIQDRAMLEEGKRKPDASSFEEVVNYEMTHRLASRSQVSPSSQFEEYAVAFEYQLIDNTGHQDAKRGGRYQAASIYGLVAPSETVARPAGEFNESRIVLRGNHVEHWLNGVKVVDTDLDTEEIRQGLESRWGKESPVSDLLTRQPRRETPIGLQHHIDEAWFRNIKIRHLERQ
jgi:hypothetical protein